jgi:uncharacterized repeat protein (TIGR02543 family)
MKKNLARYALGLLLLPLVGVGTPQTQPLQVDANISGSAFNPQILGVKMTMAETHLEQSAYFVSTDGKLYGKSGDIDTGTTFTNNPDVKYPNYLFRIHDYIAVLKDELIQDIELSQNNRFVVTQSGKVFAVGFNGSGSLGNGTTTSIDKLTDVTSFFGDLGTDKIIKLATNGNATYALTEGGQVFSYGSSYYVGNNTPFTTSSLPVTTPVNITTFFEEYDPLVDKIIDLKFNMALTASGTVYQWGFWQQPFAQVLSPEIIFSSADIPTPALNEKVVSIVPTGTGAILLTTEGRLFGIGKNDYLQLGQADTQLVLSQFTELDLSAFTFLNATNKIEFITGGFAITTNGNVIAWGTNKNGTAGRGSAVALDNSIPFTDVTAAVNTNLRADEYFVYAFKSGNPNNDTAATLISNLGIVYGLGGRYTLGFPLDGNNAPLREPRAIAPEKVTFTVDPLDGPEIGSFSWAYGYRVFFSQIVNNTPSVLNTVRPGYLFGGLFFDQALTQSAYDVLNYVATESITLYPKWFPISYNTSYLAPGLPMNHENPFQITGAMLPYTLKPATSPGRTFEGWFKDTQFTQTISVVNAEDFTNNSLLLYAKFSGVNSTTSTDTGSGGGGGTPTAPRSVLLPVLVVTATIGAIGTFSWLFFFRNLTIGGFSFVALKKWWIAFIKRKEKDDKDKK